MFWKYCFNNHIFALSIESSHGFLRHDILSVAKRFIDYETIGGLFREVSRQTVQLSVAQQIWGVLQELVTAIARVFGLLDEEVYDAVINQSDELAYIAQFYNLQSAS